MSMMVEFAWVISGSKCSEMAADSNYLSLDDSNGWKHGRSMAFAGSNKSPHFAKSYIAKSRGWVGSRGAHFYAAPFLIFKQKISHACWPSNGVWSIYCVPFQSGGFPLD